MRELKIGQIYIFDDHESSFRHECILTGVFYIEDEEYYKCECDSWSCCIEM